MTLTPKMREALGKYQAEGVVGLEGFSPRTIKALRDRDLLAEQIDAPRPVPVRARYQDTYNNWPTFDIGSPDYAFYDRLRRGKAAGMELSGLFVKPMTSKLASWVLGDAPKWEIEQEGVAEYFSEWYAENQARVIQAREDSSALGDSYVLVNPDLSLVGISPHIVSRVVDERDFSKTLGWRTYQVTPHPTRPTDKTAVEDIWTEETRTRSVYRNGTLIERRTYPNLIGMIPLIHIPNRPAADELFGRSDAEALVAAFHSYGQVFADFLNGNSRQGKAMLVIEGLGGVQQVQQLWDLYGSKVEVTLPDGSKVMRDVLSLSADDVLTLGGDGRANFLQPGSMATDATALLGLLFYLILQHTEIPEFIWGNAIASSKASAESQLDPFIKFIEKLRGQARLWLTQLTRVTCAYISIREGLPDVGSVDLKWPALTDESGALTLEAVKYAYDKGLMTDALALRLLPLEIDNPEEEVEAARAEQDELMNRMDRAAAQSDIFDQPGDQPPAEDNAA